jgi:hypothetical protein
MRRKLNIKNVVKKKIEVTSSGGKILIGKSHVDTYNEKKLRKEPVEPKSNKIEDKIKENMTSRLEQRLGNNENNKSKFKDFGLYSKKNNVDFDVAICISSFNRYDKVKRIVNQILQQESKYTFKIFIMNDGSTINIDEYNNLLIDFPEIVYLKNEVNGGKIKYWKTISDLWGKVKEYNTHALCQIDDDFILSNNFLNDLMDTFFNKKNENSSYLAFHFHTYYFLKNNKIYNDSDGWNNENNQNLDGGVLYDISFIEMINYSIDETKLKSKVDSSRVWINVSNKLKLFGGRVYRFKESLAYHDGNEDSKLNPEVRKTNKMITRNFKG